MRPVPIDEADVAMWPGGTRRVIAGPDGDLTGDIRPVEAVIDVDEYGPRFAIKIGVDAADLASLNRNGHWWLVIHADHLHPFALALEEDRQR